METSKFYNDSLGKNVKSIIENGYTIKAGTIGGNSIEEVETITSYIYYDDVNKRDADLKLIQTLIENARKQTA